VSAVIHPHARLATQDIGPDTVIAAFASVGESASLGARCRVDEHVVLEEKVVVGDAVVFGPGVVVLRGAKIGEGALLGANSTVGAGLAVGRGAVVEPGSVVADDVPANAIVRGNPARITGYVDGLADAIEVPHTPVRMAAPLESRVRGVSIHRITRVTDLRGNLMATEFAELPFVPQRLFTISGVPSELLRGSHAHFECSQLLICVAGSISCLVDDGVAREEITLDSPEVGLYIPPLVWATQYRYSADAVLTVLASLPYDAADYIRDYDEFLLVAAQQAGQPDEAGHEAD